MLKILCFALATTAVIAAAFFSGVLIERRRSLREDHLVHAWLIVSIAQAAEVGDEAKVKRLKELQMVAALRCTARADQAEFAWWRQIFILPVESGVERVWMPRIAEYVSKHPELRLTNEERSPILLYLGKGHEIKNKPANQALVPTPAAVTPVADASVAPSAGAAHL